MKKRNIIITASLLGLSGSAIAIGAFVTQSAMASAGTPDKVTVGVLVADSNGGDAIACQFDGVAVAAVSVSGAAGGPQLNVSSSADAGGVPQAGTLVVSGTATAVAGDTSGSGTIVGGSAGDLPMLTAIPAGSSGVGGPVILSSASQKVRQGTPEECAKLRPESVPAP
jgi:hypothetical protein